MNRMKATALPLRRTLVCVALVLGGQALADTAPGDTTQSLLSLQADGAQQSSNPQALSGAYREKAAARFLKTLEQPVPPVQFDTSFSGDN